MTQPERTDPTVDRIRYLADAQPTTEFERVAKSIKVKALSHNGGIYYDVDLWEILKHPTAFDLPETKLLA